MANMNFSRTKTYNGSRCSIGYSAIQEIVISTNTQWQGFGSNLDVILV